MSIPIAIDGASWQIQNAHGEFDRKSWVGRAISTLAISKRIANAMAQLVPRRICCEGAKFVRKTEKRPVDGLPAKGEMP